MDEAVRAEYRAKFMKEMDNDLNTAMGVTALYDVLKAKTTGATKLAIIGDYDTVLSLDLLKKAEAEREKKEKAASQQSAGGFTVVSEDGTADEGKGAGGARLWYTKEALPMKECISREAALAALKTYNKEPFHILHGLTVEGVMRWYANELGYGEDADFWATVGLLHDIDFEMWPEQHCRKAPELLKKAGCSDEFIHAVCSHGYGLCCDVEPTHEMEKVLFAADELTGLVGAAARMRPSKSVMDMEVSSLKKKYKDKKFAAGCSRDVINTGAERLGWTIEELMEKTILAMRSCEESVNKEMETLA